MAGAMDLMNTLMANARQAAGVQAKPSGDNATVPGKDTKTAGEGAKPAAFGDGAPNPEEDKSPLAGFVDLWQTDAGSKADLNKPVTFDLDPTKLAEAAKGLDFTKAVKPELAEKALKGDAAALAEILNSVSQSSFVQSASMSAKLIEAALKQQATAFKAALPSLIKKQNVNESLRSGENAEFLSHPSVQPLVELLEMQMTEKYPKASASQISDNVKKYLLGFGEIASGRAAQALKESKGPGGTSGLGDDNWSDFAGIDLGKGLPT